MTERISIDCNIFDKLILDESAVEKLNEAVLSQSIEILLSPTVYIELQEAEIKHGIMLGELMNYKLLNESTSFPPFIPGNVVIGGDLAEFNKLKGNKTIPKRLKDPRIFATLIANDITCFVTENATDFKSSDVVQVVSYCEFKRRYNLV